MDLLGRHRDGLIRMDTWEDKMGGGREKGKGEGRPNKREEEGWDGNNKMPWEQCEKGGRRKVRRKNY